MRPEAWKVRGDASNLRLFVRIEHVVVFGTPFFTFGLGLLELCEFLIPCIFSGPGDETMLRRHGHQMASGQVSLIRGPLDLSA